MLREFCVAIEELTRERTLVLWLEDLHWCDNATVDLLGALAHRQDPARLLVLATYRPVDAAVAGHPVASLKRSLLQRGKCQELDLPLLDESGVLQETVICRGISQCAREGVEKLVVVEHGVHVRGPRQRPSSPSSTLGSWMRE